MVEISRAIPRLAQRIKLLVSALEIAPVWRSTARSRVCDRARSPATEVLTAPGKQFLLPQKGAPRRGFTARSAARAPLKFDEKSQLNIL
jgi:hypothetical protein